MSDVIVLFPEEPQDTMPRMIIAAACPHCGETERLGVDCRTVVCGTCSARGPKGDTTMEAVMLWNSRVPLSCANVEVDDDD